MQNEWEKESSRLLEMNPNSDYIVYTNRKEKIRHLAENLAQLYLEVCKVKHLTQCIKEENAQNIEDLNFIEDYFVKLDTLDGSSPIHNVITNECNLPSDGVKNIPKLTYEVFI